MDLHELQRATRAATSGRSVSTGWAFLLGLLLPIYTITGYDASAHTSEETLDAARSVPRGMVMSVVWSEPRWAG